MKRIAVIRNLNIFLCWRESGKLDKLPSRSQTAVHIVRAHWLDMFSVKSTIREKLPHVMSSCGVPWGAIASSYFLGRSHTFMRSYVNAKITRLAHFFIMIQPKLHSIEFIAWIIRKVFYFPSHLKSVRLWYVVKSKNISFRHIST